MNLFTTFLVLAFAPGALLLTCNLSANMKNDIASHQQVVNRITNAIVNGNFSGDSYNYLQKFTDFYGSRLLGSQALEDSIDHLLQVFTQVGLENVHTENVEFTRWVRGEEKAFVLSPFQEPLPILGLGTSVGTPAEGITASAILVESSEELNLLTPAQVNGKIVIYVPKIVDMAGYTQVKQYRLYGASEAAKKGAVAALVVSLTTFSIGTLHTGNQIYSENVTKIPAASITTESAQRLLRLFRSGHEIVIKLQMNHRNEEGAVSRNTIGEIQGTFEDPTVVVLSGHLDSWDVGVGAMDNGVGAFASFKALQYLKALRLRPKRTIRAILWTGEEFDSIGSKTYQANHRQNEKNEFNFVFESDLASKGATFSYSGNEESECIFREILKLIKHLNADEYITSFKSADITDWLNRGFPGASIYSSDPKYAWFHHSLGDSIEVVDSQDLDRLVAMYAAVSYVIADLCVEMPKFLD